MAQLLLEAGASVFPKDRCNSNILLSFWLSSRKLASSRVQLMRAYMQFLQKLVAHQMQMNPSSISLYTLQFLHAIQKPNRVVYLILRVLMMSRKKFHSFVSRFAFRLNSVQLYHLHLFTLSGHCKKLYFTKGKWSDQKKLEFIKRKVDFFLKEVELFDPSMRVCCCILLQHSQCHIFFSFNKRGIRNIFIHS